jgi:Leucine-rich repeat (LRR) protein
MQLLFSLCNNFDRLTRLVHSFTDKGMGISCSAQIDALLNEGKGIVNIDFGKAFTAPTKDEPSCRSMQIYLTSEQPDLIMIEQILGQEGLICEQPEEADLIVCDAKEVDDLCLRYPRRMVIEESELLSLVNKFLGINLLRAIVASHITPVPQLPEHLSPCWAKLRKRCVASIDAGLTLFSEVVSSDPLAGDALLDQVAVEDGCLIRGKRFELVDRRTHPYSYYALLGLLSRSPAGSRGEALRMGIEALIDENPYAYDNALGIIAVPELKNFAGLRQADLRILEPATSGNAYKLSERWQSLNLLRQLTLRSDEQIDIDHLDAPHLEQLTLDGAGFVHILGIQECTHLKALDVASTDIADLGPVSNLHKTLNKLNISQTKINSFLPLGKYDFLEQLEISGCPNLNSLEGMPILNCESADFSFLCIGSLTGLGRSSSLNHLKVASCQSLIDIEELEELKSLERLEIKDCPQILDYSVLGRLPALKYVEITSGSSENVVLPSCWPGSLTELWINGNTSQIGDLPSQFAGTLDLTSVTGLTRLDNLRACSKIEEIKIRLSAINKINDFTPLSNCENLWINIDMEGDNCICDPTIESLSRLPSLRLRLDGYVNINLGPLVNLANLVGLDLDSWSHVTKAELLPVLGMNALKYFQFAAGSLPELGCTFATSGQIAKLKLQLMTL